MTVFDKFVHKYSRLPTETDPEYLEMLRMSKYIITDVPMVAPGKCANCGASKNDGRKYIDFGCQVDWYGAVYLCGDCLKDVANAMGLFDDLRKRLEEAVEETDAIRVLHEQGVELHDTIVQTYREFEDFYANLQSTSVDSSANGPLSLVTDETVSESGTSETKPGTNETKSRTSKSTPISGRKDVPSLANLINFSGD